MPSTKTLTPVQPYKIKHRLRLLTAASLFDGHDAGINIMRQLLQASGAEVIHMGHNRSAEEVVRAAIDEDVQAIALTSYQGGHMEYFRYIKELLAKYGAPHIRVYGGGGGTILAEEIKALHAQGISRVYSPEDGRKMGLQGMIDHLLEGCDQAPLYYLTKDKEQEPLSCVVSSSIAWRMTEAENYPKRFGARAEGYRKLAARHKTPVIGVSGTGGAGKSSLLDEVMYRYLRRFPTHRVGVFCVDPSRKKTGGALLGDRIRMNVLSSPQVYMRSMATRNTRSLPAYVADALLVMKAAGFDVIFLESAGIGQGDAEISTYTDFSVYAMTPEYGAASQLEKISMLDYADLVVINKSDRRGAKDALRDVKKQYRRNHQRFSEPFEAMPVYGTIGSQFNDAGVNIFFDALIDRLFLHKKVLSKGKQKSNGQEVQKVQKGVQGIIPPSKVRYLAEIAESVRKYNTEAQQAKKHASLAQAFHQVLAQLPKDAALGDTRKYLDTQLKEALGKLSTSQRVLLEGFEKQAKAYRAKEAIYHVRDKEIRIENYTRTLSGTLLPKVSPPRYDGWGDRMYWLLQENFPGYFPYTSGIYPYRRTEEAATRMFAGEGAPERTNQRFHFLSKGLPYARLSTAFDSVTLYGEDPAERLDIYGKVGNSGVSIATLDDMKKLYSGFDLLAPSTSVSMTINGPASIICAYFMHAAIDQQVELYLRKEGNLEAARTQAAKRYEKEGIAAPHYAMTLPEGHDQLGIGLLGISAKEVIDKETYAKIATKTLKSVRGTVQADILKEDQAQNTCIYSTDFSLRLMGDMQAHFIDQGVKNFYSVSISGYHIAEAGANPITQLAFTLANGFTYVEYYLSRGMPIDAFASNLSFFFSNGLDPEYAVIGRVARRIWAKVLRERYGANERSQKFKYHVQTSGRSLHAQEIAFNDIRTTLQALYALYDNCNSLHTNAYDEAITTPTEESVRRALAIQQIINLELGAFKAENILQGSFVMEELSDLVEEAVLSEFERINERGGVLGAMENMYQRAKIQEESMHYEMLKSSGSYPIVGVNTFLSENPEEANASPNEVIRATEEEKKRQIAHLSSFQHVWKTQTAKHLKDLQEVALRGENIFASLMEVAPYCSLGQISAALYEVGGRYRRSM